MVLVFDRQVVEEFRGVAAAVGVSTSRLPDGSGGTAAAPLVQAGSRASAALPLFLGLVGRRVIPVKQDLVHQAEDFLGVGDRMAQLWQGQVAACHVPMASRPRSSFSDVSVE